MKPEDRAGRTARPETARTAVGRAGSFIRKNNVLPGSGPTDLHFGKNGIVPAAGHGPAEAAQAAAPPESRVRAESGPRTGRGGPAEPHSGAGVGTSLASHYQPAPGPVRPGRHRGLWPRRPGPGPDSVVRVTPVPPGTGTVSVTGAPLTQSDSEGLRLLLAKSDAARAGPGLACGWSGAGCKLCET